MYLRPAAPVYVPPARQPRSGRTLSGLAYRLNGHYIGLGQDGTDSVDAPDIPVSTPDFSVVPPDFDGSASPSLPLVTVPVGPADEETSPTILTDTDLVAPAPVAQITNPSSSPLATSLISSGPSLINAIGSIISGGNKTAAPGAAAVGAGRAGAAGSSSIGKYLLIGGVGLVVLLAIGGGR